MKSSKTRTDNFKKLNTQEKSIQILALTWSIINVSNRYNATNKYTSRLLLSAALYICRLFADIFLLPYKK